jgi:hypothetical protein
MPLDKAVKLGNVLGLAAIVATLLRFRFLTGARTCNFKI